MKGIVFDIQRFSLHDGPGIRTTVFLKGCSNRCLWCHNPESISVKPELQLFLDKCIGCGKCFKNCPVNAHRMEDGKRVFDRHKCTGCGICSEECFAMALRLAGKEMTVDEVVAEVLKDADYYKSSGGGVTISGGEPVLQSEFTREILKACKAEGINTAIQTAGNYPWEYLNGIIEYTDIFMYDLKLITKELSIKYIGNDGERIKENLFKLSHETTGLIVRTPVIGGVNDNEEEISAVTSFISGFENLLYYELVPYHKLGEGKYGSLGKEYDYDFYTPSKERLKELADVALRNVKNVRGY